MDEVAVSKAFKNLSEVLEDVIKVYRVMLDLVRREKDILIAANMEELEECNKAKEAMVLKVKGLERIREKVSREMAIVVGTNPETARLLEIASKLIDPQSSKF